MDCEPVMFGSVSHQFSAGADLSSTHAEYRRGSNYYRWGVTQSVMQSDYGEFSQTDFYPKSRRKTPRNPVGSRSFKLKVHETHGLFLLTSIVHL